MIHDFLNLLPFSTHMLCISNNGLVGHGLGFGLAGGDLDAVSWLELGDAHPPEHGDDGVPVVVLGNTVKLQENDVRAFGS